MYLMRKIPIGDDPIVQPPLELRQFDIDSPAGAAAAGPIAAMHAELGSRLTAEEYERWLLPPEPREGLEKVVHWLSLGAGVIAFTGGAGLLWLIL